MDSTDSIDKILIILQHTIISLIGIIGNFLVILVYKKKLNDKRTITYFITHLSKVDLFCCIVSMPINCYHELNIENFSSDFICKFHSFLTTLNITYSCLVMVLIAFERYFSLCFPIKTILSRKSYLIIMFILFMVSLLISGVSGAGIGNYFLII